MSLQITLKNYEKIGQEINLLSRDGNEEFLIHLNDEYEWNITADKRKFWSWLLTPAEQNELRDENKRLRDLSNRILDTINTYYEESGENEKEVIANINLLVQKLIL